MKANHLVYLLIGLVLATNAFAQQKEITLATLEWEPYVGSSMNGKGFAAEIVLAALHKAGYKVNIEFYPWTKGLEIAKEGRVEGIFPAYHSKSREAHFEYSDPFASSPLGLCKIRAYAVSPGTGGGGYKTGYSFSFSVDPRVDQTGALRALKEYKFGVVAGYVNTPAFDAADFLTKVEAPTDEAALKMLFRDEVQLIVIDKYVMQNIVTKKFPWRGGEVQFMEPPLDNRDLFIAFSKKIDDYQTLVKAFNIGLKLIKEDLVLDRIMRKYGF